MDSKLADRDILAGSHILVVDDETDTVEYLVRELRRRVGEGELVTVVESGKEAIEKLFRTSPPKQRDPATTDDRDVSRRYDAVIVDIRMKPMDGYALTRKIREKDDEVVIVFMTLHEAYKGHEALDEFRRLGANGFLAKEDDKANMALSAARDVEIIASAVRRKSLLKRIDHIKYLDDWSQRGDVVAKDPRMLQVLLQVDKFAQSDEPVLLLGETGVGKDVIAKAIHKRSRRADMPFVPVIIPELGDAVMEFFGVGKGCFTGVDARLGLFEAANGGTIFLDEIGEMPLEDQAKLLGVLQRKVVRRKGETHDRPVDVRVIAATLQPLQEMVDRGTFRPDLFRRLDVLKTEIPPLRERQGDVAPLAELFLRQAGRGLSFTPGCLDVLESYDWPRNVGQLEAVIKAAAVNADPAVGITPWDIVFPSRKPRTATEAVVPYEEGVAVLLENALDAAGGDAGKAEELLAKGDNVRGRWLRRQAQSLKGKVDGFASRFPRLAGLVS